MLGIVGAVLRFVIGFVLACLTAGVVQVLFAVTPTELVVAGQDRWLEAFNWSLLTATQVGVFAWPFALIAWILSEWLSIRSFAFHALVAIAISTAGFGLLYSSELPTDASIVNSYAMAAYLTTGFAAGVVYWLFAGRWARRAEVPVHMESDRTVTSAIRPDSDSGNSPRPQVVSTGTVPATRPPAATSSIDDDNDPTPAAKPIIRSI